MKRRYLFAGATSAALILAGCNSSSTPTQSPSPSATSTPIATPTSSPTPTPVSTPFPISAPTTFNTISAELDAWGPRDPSEIGSATLEPMSDVVVLTLDTSTSTGTFSIRRRTDQATYAARNFLTTTNAPEGPEYVFGTNGVPQNGVSSFLRLLKNSNATERGSYTGPQLNSVSYATWERFQPDPVEPVYVARRYNASVFGAQTAAADVPTSGTYTYNSILIGDLHTRAERNATTSSGRLTGSVTVTVNFSTGLIDLRLTLLAPGVPSTVNVPYGTFIAQGALPAGQNQFSGLFVPGSTRSGSFRGGFFGPQAREIGIAFAGSITSSALTERFAGAVVGRRP